MAAALDVTASVECSVLLLVLLIMLQAAMPVIAGCDADVIAVATVATVAGDDALMFLQVALLMLLLLLLLQVAMC
jgi:hypothetical protein